MLRVAGGDSWLIDQLARSGVSPRDVAGAETRPACSSLAAVARELIQQGVEPGLGLKAGQAYQTGDLDTFEHVAASAPTLREALGCASRYMRLLHSGLESELEECGDHAFWRFCSQDVSDGPALINDFTLALALEFVRVHTGRRDPVVEVHVQHSPVAYAPDYLSVFGGTVRFDMPHNALVFRRELLDLPMLRANGALHGAFHTLANEHMNVLGARMGVRGKVRELVTAQLRSGDTRMSTVAESLAMSVATLRRRLDDEETSHTEILDEVRHELAKVYLRDPRVAISEVSSMLGFSHVAAFYKAFRRWTAGGTPASFRGRVTVDALPS
jgi:AraC-like DNA-binding protein